MKKGYKAPILFQLFIYKISNTDTSRQYIIINPHVFMNQFQQIHITHDQLSTPRPLPGIFKTNHRYVISSINISLLPHLKSFKMIFKYH